ncbi:MAG: hypothetical protein AB4042_05670, partial [Leptolyngbyaceae cyanobacterium]
MTKDLRVASFIEPIVVDAIVVDAHIRREGGGQWCRPIFRFEVNGKTWTTQIPSSNPQSCYIDGDTVALTVDTTNPKQ